jgi:hypothetical protein
MMSHAREAEARKGGRGSDVVCAWCGGVMRGGASKARKRMCQPCFERMMREYSRAHQSPSAVPHASER